MNKTTHNMNKTLKLKVMKRSLLLLAAMLLGGMTAQGQTYYVFYNSTYGYIYNNNGTPTVSTTFTKSAIWAASGTLGNTGRSIYSYTATTQYLRGGRDTDVSLGSSQSNWRSASSALNYDNRSSGYVNYTGTKLTCSNSSSNRFTPYNFTINNNVAVTNPTLGIAAEAGLTNGGIQLSSSITGTYAPACTSAVVRNYNNSSTQTYYWTSSTEASTTRPGLVDDWSDATITWTVTIGDSYASVSSDGLVTLTANPTGNVVVRMNVSKGGYSGNTSITLTQAAIAQNVTENTTLTTPTMSPTSATLYKDENQAFTSSATATTTTTTVPAHVTLTGGGNTYYYYDGALYSSTSGFSTAVETHPDVTLTWALSGDAASYLSRTPATGTSTTVTHSTQSPSDLTATLTVTASATGATPKTATATITAYAAAVVAPTITRTGDAISLATTSLDATIYYTTDGSTPTAGSTPYSGPFDLTTSPTTVKAIAIRDVHSSAVTSETFQLTLPDPVVSINQSTGVVTISAGEGSPDGVTFRYNKGDSPADPTESTGTVGTSTTLGNMQYIKVIATKTGYTSSNVVTALYVNAGLHDGQVILDDREDHSWAYYNKELDSPIRSWNPADVKITYKGMGYKYTTVNNSGVPTGDYSALANTETVQVGILGETQHTFIYFKTLERIDGTTDNNPSGRCAYRAIPNPFSVRPRINAANIGGTGASATNYTGFYKWLLTTCTGGNIYTTSSGGSALTPGSSTVDADQLLYFAPSSEYGMVVEFKAIWAPASVGSAGTRVSGTNAYERNFYIGGTTALSYAATITAVYPDGTNGSNTTLLNAVPNTTQGDDYSCSNDTKFEYIQMAASLTLTANNHYLALGRGCGTTNNVMTRVRGMSAGTSDALNYTLRIESGRMNYLAFVKGTYNDDYGYSGWGGGRNADQFTNSTSNNIRVVLGSDYDRANDVNTNLYVNNDAAMGSYCSFSTPANHHTLHATIKSGSFGPTNINDLGTGGEDFVYLGVSRSYSNTGLRQLYIEGGQISHLAGGIDGGNSTDTAIYVRMSGGHILGCMYGSGAFAAAAGIRKYVITGGNIQGWVAGGCNGVGESEGGTMDGETFLYIGGDAKIGYNASGTSDPTSINDVVGGTVFAAGRGNSTSGSGRVNYSNLVLADVAKVLNNAYGGGNLGFTQYTANVWLFGNCTIGGKVFGGSNIKDGNTTNIYMKGGTVTGGVYGGINGEGYAGSGTFALSGNTTINISGGTAVGGVYGGGYGTNNLSCDVTGTVTITMTGGTVKTGLFGGGNVNSKIGGKATLNLNGGTVGVSAADSANVYGGGLGAATRMKGDVEVNIGGATIHGDVYGGSAKGITNCNDAGTARNSTAKTDVALSAGTVYGSIYGGGHGIDAAEAHVWGPVTVTVSGGSVKDPGTGNPASVFGCNNLSGSPKNSVAVVVTHTDPSVITAGVKSYAINGVYGGGNQAHYDYDNGDNPTVTISGCATSIRDVYGGGNAAAVPSTHVSIDGGDIDRVFGGGNGESGTPAHVGYKNKTENSTSDPYSANGNANVAITGGTINQVFGGSNAHGTIKGSINLGVSSTNDECPEYIGELFGGANLAEITANLSTTIACGTTFGKVYGGSKQASITGNVTLTINGGTVDEVYAGSEGTAVTAANITGNTVLNLYGGAIGSAFGGSNVNGNITGTISVNLDWSQSDCADKSVGYIYGASNLATYDPTAEGALSPNYSPVVTLTNGTVDHNVFGSGKGTDDDYSDGLVTSNPQVVMNNASAWVKENIYGGGEMASVGVLTRNGDGIVTAATANRGCPLVQISAGKVGPDGLNPTNENGHGYVFGGGLGKPSTALKSYAAYAYCYNTKVEISGSAEVRGSVFGGSESGHVFGDTWVAVTGGTVGVRVPIHYRSYEPDGTTGVTNRIYSGNVYGGGRGVTHVGDFSQTAGRVYGNTRVDISGTAHIRHSVYGGGSMASVGTYTLTPDDHIYGGYMHNFTANTGKATLNISGGRIGPSWADLYVNTAGDALLNGSYEPVSDAARDTLVKYFKYLGENEGMVYGSGRGVNYDFDEEDVSYDHTSFIELAFTNNTEVNISGTADVVGSVFGGGENGHVKTGTQVNISGGTIGGMRLHHNGFYLPDHPAVFIEDANNEDDELEYNVSGVGSNIFRGNVYGGGRGVDHINVATGTIHTGKKIFSVSAGRVYGNTEVNITGGTIYHNVFGGGSIASVGTYTYPNDDFENSSPNAAEANTGTTTVNVSGGQIGVMGENEGGVYGGGRGIAGATESQVTHLAFVNATVVNISSDNSHHADVRGSVFGGGMNGHVLTNTQVTVSGGVIGGKTDAEYGSYDTENFPLGAKPASADTTIHGTAYYSGIRANDTLTRHDGTGPATVFLGNVYGGGRGVDTYDGTLNSFTAGRVYGNTVVNITGGVIYHSVFGGGSIASVGTYTTYSASEAATDAATPNSCYRINAGQPKALDTSAITPESGHWRNEYSGKATVTVSGGRIGTNGRNNGRVFGSSRGMAGTNYRGLGYVNIAHVTISGGLVKGSVFGSGENGHVLDSTLVTISGGHIGNGKRTGANAWMNSYIGNVYGGGRGLDRTAENASTVSPFAGRVYRSANVVVTGGQIDHSVYGGGSLASVGRYKRNTTTDTITYADPNMGICRVTVSGGTIGIDGEYNGHVFGSSRGTATSSNNVQSSLAYVADTRVDIQTGATIKGSVFGGGESGHVQRNTVVTVSGGTIGKLLTKNYSNYTAAERQLLDLMGNVYGGGRGVDTFLTNNNTVANYSMSAGYVRGTTSVTISGTPTIYRNVYGGGSMGCVGDYGVHCAADFWRGSGTNGTATVTIQGTVGHATNVGYGYGGNVYGSSRGQANDPDHDASLNTFYANGGFGAMAYVYKTHVIVETGADVKGNVYGGGENGHVDYGGTTVDILNGTVAGNVFGGGKGTSTSPTAGIIDGPTVVNIGSADQTSEIDAYGSHNTVVIGGDVFAGNDSYSSPLGTMTVNVYHTKHTAANKYPTLHDPVVASDTAGNSTASKYALHGVYGGGNLADVLTGIAAVDASDGNASHVYDQKYITQRIAQSDGSVPARLKPWPGGITRKSIVNIYNCEENTIMYVFGGGRAAKTIQDTVTIEGGRIYQAYAGGDGSSAAAYVGYVDGGSLRSITGAEHHGNAGIKVTGGIVHQVFGGCNTQGEVYGASNVEFEEGGVCDIINSEVFGGNNVADMHGNKTVTIKCGTKWTDIYGGSNKAHMFGNVTLNIEGGVMERAFGGSKEADIDGNVTVNVTGGSINELFGGNNVSGNIKGTIEVNVDCDPENTCADARYLGTVYGGGKDAAYNPFDCFRHSPMVNIKCGTVSGDVYGGGLGATARTVSYPRVIVGGFGGGRTDPRVLNNVYGGGYGAPVYGNTIAEVRSTIIGNDGGTAGSVFGGGYGTTAVVNGETYVGIFGTSDIKKNVYGGGNAGPVLGSTDVQIAYEEQLLPPETRAEMDEGTVYATLVSGTADATIRYTLDGTDPTPSTGTVFNGTRFAIDFGDDIKAIACKDGMIPSVVSINQAPTPSITIDGASATLDGYLGAKLYYTTDGSEPTTGSTLYGGAPVDETGYDPSATISVGANTVIKVLAVMRGCANSHVAYLKAAEPTISFEDDDCTITAPAGARIIYTTDGTNPTSAMGGGTAHGTAAGTNTVNINNVADGTTVKAIVELNGYMPSNISATKYVAP